MRYRASKQASVRARGRLRRRAWPWMEPLEPRCLLAVNILDAINAGFAVPSVGAGLAYGPIPASGWTFTAQSPTAGSGIAGNGSSLTAGNSAAPEGTQVAFLQGTGRIAQNVPGWQTGTEYVVAFSAARRANGAGLEDFQVLLDGTPLTFQGATTITPSSTSYASQVSDAVNVAASGNHVLSFVGIDSAGQDDTAAHRRCADHRARASAWSDADVGQTGLPGASAFQAAAERCVDARRLVHAARRWHGPRRNRRLGPCAGATAARRRHHPRPHRRRVEHLGVGTGWRDGPGRVGSQRGIRRRGCRSQRRGQLHLAYRRGPSVEFQHARRFHRTSVGRARAFRERVHRLGFGGRPELDAPRPDRNDRDASLGLGRPRGCLGRPDAAQSRPLQPGQRPGPRWGALRRRGRARVRRSRQVGHLRLLPAQLQLHSRYR